MLLITNARIYTGFKGAPIVNALLIHDDRVLAAGAVDEITALAEPGTAQIDFNGKTILPGLTDSHMHLKQFSLGLRNVLAETDTIDECLRRVAEKAAETPAGEWITGWGWNQNVWPGGYGTAAQLDAVADGHPVCLSAKSGHAIWVNSKALELAGITAQTTDPEGGVILRGSNGEPTGILMENASELIFEKIPPASFSAMREAVLAGQEKLWSMGITGIHDFSILSLFPVLQNLDQAGLLKLRVVKGIPVEDLDTAVAAGLTTGFGSDFVKTGSVKCFMDGALGPQTAGMLEPFENSQERGIVLMTADEVFEIGRKASSHGMSLAIHAIGDRANRVVLDGYEKLREFEKANGYKGLQHRIEHAQLLHPDDLPRLAKLGIIGSMQPIHCTSDMLISDRYWGKRASGAYAFRTLLDYNTRLIFGSDAPVETPNPFVGIHAAVTRRRADGTPGEQGWNPQEKLPLHEVLHAYTAAPALSSGFGTRLGTLTSGSFADLIVLSQDPFEIQAQDLHQISPDATMVGGTWVWAKPG